MTVIADSGPTLAFDMGRVARRVVELIKSQGLFLAIGSVLGVGVPDFFRVLLAPKLLAVILHGSSWEAKVGRYAIGEIGALLVSACGALVSAWIVLIMVGTVTGEHGADLAKSAREVAGKPWSIVLTGIIYSVGVTIGTFLLVVPGIFLMTAWYVATPVVAYEHRPIRATFDRSLELTRGNRGHIFALLFALGAGEIIVNLTAMKMASPGLSFVAMSHAPISRLVISPFLSAIEHVVSASAMAAMYIELVGLKDGGFRSAVLAAFD